MYSPTATSENTVSTTPSANSASCEIVAASQTPIAAVIICQKPTSAEAAPAFSPIQLGLFFAGTVLIVFASGMLATKLAPRYGLDRSIRGGLFATATGAIAMLLVSLYSPSFLPFLAAMSVFLLGMGIVNPLGTAQALSPFGAKAGAASALVGFWQMMTAAIGVWLAATISHDALFALGVVLTVFSIVAVGLYTRRAKAVKAA